MSLEDAIAEARAIDLAAHREEPSLEAQLRAMELVAFFDEACQMAAPLGRGRQTARSLVKRLA